MNKYRGCQASRNDRIGTHSSSLRKVINTFSQQLKERRNPISYKHCASAIIMFFMSNNRHNAPL